MPVFPTRCEAQSFEDYYRLKTTSYTFPRTPIGFVESPMKKEVEDVKITEPDLEDDGNEAKG